MVLGRRFWQRLRSWRLWSGGDGYGDGQGSYGYGDGYYYGSGESVGRECQDYIDACADVGLLTARTALALRNMELRRSAIERIGTDRFFAELEGEVIHADRDGHGNPRRLIGIPVPDAATGYILAVHVRCPTTSREYYLGVPPDVRTCQQAVASLFGMRPEEYAPIRET